MNVVVLNILLSFFVLNSGLISEIKKECDNIDFALDSYRVKRDKDINVYKEINSANYSIEGAKISGLAIINLYRYYDETGIRKTVVSFEGEQQDLVSEYYFKYDDLIFVSKKHVRYRHAKYADSFDELDKTIKEELFYFNKNKLIEFLGCEKDSVVDSTIMLHISKEIIRDAKLYKNFEE